MYRLALCIVFLVIGVYPTIADDSSVCAQRTGNEAISACSRLLTLNPKDVIAYENRGDAYFDKGDYDRAIADFDQEIRLDPKYANAYVDRSGVYAKTGDYDRAIAEADKAIRLNPKIAAAYVNRSAAYAGKGEYDRAIAEADEAIRLDPRNVSAYGNRGLAYNYKHDYDRGIADLNRSIRLDPKNTLAYANRGFAYNGKDDYDRAIADEDQAIRLDPKNGAFAHAIRGKAYTRKGDHERAIVDLDEAIRLDPKLARAYTNRGELYEARNDRGRALADFEEALRRDPSETDAQAGRQRVQVMLVKRPGAVPQVSGPTDTDAATPVAGASPGRRIALVIGMTNYTNVSTLANPTNDARAVTAAFRRLGFADVIEREDLTRAGLEETLRDFGDEAVEADWAVVYYAGHGVELNGENYLVPVDAKLNRADHVEEETVTLKRVLSKVEAAHKMRMVILDACRNSPFRMASADGRPRAVGRGLSPVEPAGGVLVAYAARGGTVADDGSSEHSPFTQALLANMETPGLEISVMFRRVRDQVLARTHNAQEPFTYGSLPGEELYFNQAGR